jgi:hypothetical protein
VRAQPRAQGAAPESVAAAANSGGGKRPGDPDMSRNAGTRVAVGLGLLCAVAACSGGSEPSGRRPSSSAAAGSGGPSRPPSAPSEPESSFDPSTTDTDNPGLLPPPDPNAMRVDAGDGCQDGKFCPPPEPDPLDCGKIELKTKTKTIDKPGNVLVVFDRSGSMEGDWNGTPKYQAAGNALIAAITPLKDLLTMGGIFFPSAGMPDATCPMGCNVADPLHWIPGPQACCLNLVGNSCSVNTIDKPDQLDFAAGDAFITGLPMQWHLQGASSTPLQLALQRAAEAISGRTWTDPLLVIVMTDGEPNCELDPPTVLNQLTTWHAAGISTHVVGLPGAQAAQDVLNMMAQAGGTDTYIDPADPMELENRLRSVISSTVKSGFESCIFEIDPKAAAPEKLHLIVTQNGKEADVARDLSPTAHWKINDEGTVVELEGQLCEMAKDGTFEQIRFVFGCVDTPPLDPPPLN